MCSDTRLAYNISGVNLLPEQEKLAIYTRLLPQPLLDRFDLTPPFVDHQGNSLLILHCPAGSMDAELKLYHRVDADDPVLFGHISDTINGQVRMLLYVINDPDSPRFDVDHMPDGTPTIFGTNQRNLEAEIAAMQYGLAPGQIHRGLRMLGIAIQAFDRFVQSLGATMYFADPLYYHTAIMFEHHGFAYEKGRRFMERIQQGFAPGGDLLDKLDGSTPFRQPEAANSIRLRSWAIHDDLFGEPYTNVTMYKMIGRSFDIDTSSGCPW